MVTTLSPRIQAGIGAAIRPLAAALPRPARQSLQDRR